MLDKRSTTELHSQPKNTAIIMKHYFMPKNDSNGLTNNCNNNLVGFML